MPNKRQEATSGRCNAMTKAGSSCAAPAIRGGEFFALHSDPGRAAQLGRKGGMGNRDGAEVAVPKNRADGFHQRPIRMLLTTLAEHAFRTKDLLRATAKSAFIAWHAWSCGSEHERFWPSEWARPFRGLLSGLLSSDMFTLSGPVEGSRSRLPAPAPSQPKAGWLGPRCRRQSTPHFG